MDLTDQNLSIPCTISEILSISCMQLSLNQQYMYFGGVLKCNKARKSSPILAFSTTTCRHKSELFNDFK